MPGEMETPHLYHPRALTSDSRELSVGVWSTEQGITDGEVEERKSLRKANWYRSNYQQEEKVILEESLHSLLTPSENKYTVLEIANFASSIIYNQPQNRQINIHQTYLNTTL